jgi:aminomethyltransferase
MDKRFNPDVPPEDEEDKERAMLQATASATSLIEQHRALGAHLVDYAGWTMPVRYGSSLDEHRAVRDNAGLFDVSHMGELWVEGSEAAAALDYALVSEPSSLAAGRAEYSMICAPDGGVIDDLIVYRIEADQFLVVANASNARQVSEELGARITAKDFDATLRDDTYATSLVALQGPNAERILSGVASGGDVRSLRRYSIQRGTVCGIDAMIARTGYTGEDGFEIFASWQDAPAIWNGLLYSSDLGGPVPSGLGARDTLRLEAGMPLYGNELTRETTPFDAGLGHVVSFAKPGDFVGRRALEQAAELGPHTRLLGLVIRGRGIARHGYPVFCPGAGLPCGTVTSGAPSPTLGEPIAMAYVTDLSVKPGDHIEIGIRRERVEAEVVTLPFYRREGNGNGRSR